MKRNRLSLVLINALLLALLVIECISCKNAAVEEEQKPDIPLIESRFTLMSPEETRVSFSNDIKEDFNYNNFVFEYIYNGGGVATGDVNGDSLPDLYFSASMLSNKLYINLGQLKFLDVTDAAGVGLNTGFKTGVTMADVNGDGRLDIYSCRTSKSSDETNADLLYINMGNRLENGIQIPVFEEQSRKLGIIDNKNTNHNCFFDFDRDGDLDLFILNHRIAFSESNSLRLQEAKDGSVARKMLPETPYESNRLYENVNGKFRDMTEKAGLESSAFGLSATPADINQDGWMDLYIANDFIEPDQIFINNRNGTFTDRCDEYLKHMSQSSMGADVADINNDGLPDILVMDMKAEDPFRYKELMNLMQYDRYNLMVQYGYGRQDGRNVLQLNNGNGTFSEIGQYAGVSATDWSWSPLLADFDNDGWKDAYITNGYRKDLTQQDYFTYFRDSIERTGGLSSDAYPDIQQFLKYLPEKKIPNYFYINNHHLGFTNATQASGLDRPSFSNGSAYADLDRDGDLDIIVNNIGEPAFIFRNDIKGKNWIQIDVQQASGNTDGIGTTADVYAGGAHQFAMLMINKGFYSSSEPIMHFGLGASANIDSIILTWTDGSREILKAVKSNQRLVWKKGTGTPYKPASLAAPKPLFTNAGVLPAWKHHENDFVDFKRERLLPYMLSAEGPCLAVGDVNGDKLEDVYAGNGNGFSATIFLQQADQKFIPSTPPSFIVDSVFEDCGSHFEDFDQDGDLDLVVISGGAAFKLNEPIYMTRAYINDGKGNFSRDASFPIVRTNAGALLSVDIDGDKDIDLLIGGRSTPGLFPKAPKSYLLRNDQGKFTDVTQQVFPALDGLGMITDIQSADLDGDGMIELIIAGEWMPLTIFSFDGKSFTNKTKAFGLEKTNGWWKSIAIEDIDGDGDADIVAGNLGLNHRLKASLEFPITLISKDFDGNGSTDPIMCFYHDRKLYPYAGRDAIIAQIPALKKKFLRYTPYASATISDIFNDEELKGSTYLYAYTFSTTLYRNDGKSFVPVLLPYQAQLSPVNDIIIRDFNQDGRKDILMAGNFSYAETETGEIDAGNGTLLIQQADGSFQYVVNRDHGFWAQKEVRELDLIRLANGQEAILTGNNRGPVELTYINN